MPKQVNDASASPIDAAINAISGQLKKYGLELVERPTFKPQGNFTFCQVKVKKTRGRKIWIGLAVAKRNCNDRQNPITGQQLALQRAIFGHHYNNCTDKVNCSCW